MRRKLSVTRPTRFAWDPSSAACLGSAPLSWQAWIVSETTLKTSGGTRGSLLPVRTTKSLNSFIGALLYPPSGGPFIQSRFSRRNATVRLGTPVNDSLNGIVLHGTHCPNAELCRFQALEPFLAPGGVQVVPSYEQAADQLQVSIAAVKTLIHRMRRQFTILLREQVARTVSDSAEIDAEIHSLCEALVASEGRLGP